MRSVDPTSDPIVALLDKSVRSEDAAAYLKDVVQRVLADLATAPDPGLMTIEVVPLAVFGEGLPETVKSALASAVNPGTEGGEEEAPSSRWVFTLSGGGAFELESGGEWTRHEVSNDAGTRWMSLPPGTWYTEALGESPWVMLWFYSFDVTKLLPMELR